MARLILAAVGAILPGAAKRLYFRLVLGAHVEKGARIGFGTVVWADRIRIGRHATIGRFCRIKTEEFRVDSFCAIGDFVRITVNRCHMHSRSIVSSNVTVVGDAVDPRSVFRMGMHSWILQDCHVNVTRAVTMGRNVGVGGGSYIFTHGFWLSKLEGYPVSFGPVEFGNDVWIPWGCFILPGVKVGSGVVMGARSLVNKDVPEGALIGGIPAKVIRERSNRDVTDEEKFQMLEEVTADLAQYSRKTFARESGPEWTDLFLESDHLLRLHQIRSPGAASFAKGALNISLEPPRPGFPEGMAWLSLSDSSSSPFASLSEGARQWLDHARLIGLRFYPVDELAQYREAQ